MTKPTNIDAAKARAEALFSREPADAAHQAAATATNAEAEKIARLRALRLAKEELEKRGAKIRKARRQAQ